MTGRKQRLGVCAASAPDQFDSFRIALAAIGQTCEEDRVGGTGDLHYYPATGWFRAVIPVLEWLNSEALMGMDIAKLRKLVALDEDDPLSRFALGQALFKEGSTESLNEAAEHLSFANSKDPDHLATYHILGQVLIRLGRTGEARTVLTAGCEKVKGIGEGKGRDLGPVMAELLGGI